MKDLFEIVNGEWYRETEIPAEYASWGTFQELRLDSLKQCRELAEADQGLVGTAYRSFMEHRGGSPTSSSITWINRCRRRSGNSTRSV